MDAKQILNSSYLDILFNGKNKEYGGYELRKKYQRRAGLAGLLAVLLVGGIFGAMLIKPKEKVDDSIVDNTPVVTEMKNLEPPPLKENEPPPPPPPSAPPPPMKPTVKFTVPEIKEDNKVVQDAKIDLNAIKDDKKSISFDNKAGSNDANAADADINLNHTAGGGAGGALGGGGGGDDDSKTKVFRSVEQKAEPSYDFTEYLQNNIKYPSLAKEEGIKGKIQVEFIVEKDGTLTNVKVIKGREIGYGLPEEAIRVVKNAPKWKPAKQNNQPVRFQYSVPVTFELR